MGTSNSFSGQGNHTPLVPSWLGDTSENMSDGNLDDGEDNFSLDDPDLNNALEKDATIQDASHVENPNPSGRFTAARTNFTKFINSGGRDRKALGRSVSSYISKASGGSNTAAKRIGASKRVAARVTGFLNTARTEGLAVALNSHNLGILVGQPIETVFIGLLNDICPDGGNIDEGLARSAFVETIAQLISEGMQSIDNLSIEQFQHVLEVFVTNTIEGRLYNDIGAKIICESESVQTAEFIQGQVHDFIKGSVSDAISRHTSEFQNLTGLDTNVLVDRIYIDAYDILESLSENEAHND